MEENIALEIENNPSRTIQVLYGTQTGCAQEVAHRIVREARRLYFKTSVSALDDFDVVSI
jgi:sulfite reductase alpha subunit-like flavoprotein